MEDAADRVVAHYERHALAWDADRRAASWIDKPFIERFLSFVPRGANILDLGCGGGSPIALHIVARGFRVTGVDSSPTLISLCRTRMPDQEWIVGDMRSLTLPRRFDGILAWDSFFHLKHKDQEAMFRVFAAHAARAAILMFNAGFGHDVIPGQEHASRGVLRNSRGRDMAQCAPFTGHHRLAVHRLPVGTADTSRDGPAAQLAIPCGFRDIGVA